MMRIENKFVREVNVRMLVNVCRGWEPVGTMAWIEGELKLVTATTYLQHKTTRYGHYYLTLIEHKTPDL